MATGERTTFWSSFAKILRSSDMFGEKITLNYNGTPYYKTVIGGAASCVVYLILAIISAVLIK